MQKYSDTGEEPDTLLCAISRRRPRKSLLSALDTTFTPGCGSNASERKRKRKRRREPASQRARDRHLVLEQVTGGSSAGQPEVSRTFPSPCIKCFPALSRSHTGENARCLLTRTPGVNSRLGRLSKPEMLLLHLLGEFQVPSQGLALQQDPGAWTAPPPLRPPNPFLLLRSNAMASSQLPGLGLIPPRCLVLPASKTSPGSLPFFYRFQKAPRTGPSPC